MVEAQGRFYTVAGGRAYEWTPAGYRLEATPADARLVTPPSTVRALKAGYRPVLHPSLKAD
jgi:hypothetical protein